MVADSRVENNPENNGLSIWKALDDWGQQLSGWQKLLLRAAVRNDEDASDAIDRAYDLFCAENDLAEIDPKQNTEAESLSSVTGRVHGSSAQAITLIGIEGLQNVNALPSGSALPFGPDLTVIYGGNGAGKSGFFRFLANACFSRGTHTLLPNVYDGTSEEPQGILNIDVGNGAPKALKIDSNNSEPELKRVTVFDASVARAHLTDSNPLGFEPAGFDVFEKMRDWTEELASRLAADIGKRERENDFENAFTDESPVQKIVSTLDDKTDLEALRKLAEFNEDDQARIEQLAQSLAELRANSPAQTIAKIRQVQAAIPQIKDELAELDEFIGVEGAKRHRELLEKLLDALSDQEQAGFDKIGNPALAHTGSSQWFEFMDQAKAYADLEKETFPETDDPCPLCHRPLDEPSASLIRRFWGLLGHEKRKAVEEANNEVSEASATLAKLNIQVASKGSARRELIGAVSPDFLKWCDAAQEEINKRMDNAVTALENGDVAQLATTPISLDFDALTKLDSALEGQVSTLQAGDVEKTIASLESERVTLRHKEILKENLGSIVGYVEDQKWAAKARIAHRQLNSRYATTKGTQLFRTLIEGRYKSRLDQECGKLKCSLPFSPKLSGRAGKTLKSLQVDSGHKTVEVFSEGEQRALALADFLTEVNLNPDAAGVVLDDPVTSLDHERKELIAERLAQEAKVRQVIVFTHDLVFLSALLDQSEQLSLSTVVHWVQRQNDSPGAVSLNDSPSNSRQYRDEKIAEQRLQEAKQLTGQDQVDKIKSAAGALRRTLEEIVTNKLLNGVVVRWKEPISLMRLKQVNWQQQNVDEIVKLFEDISRLIEGHSNSDEYAGAMPDISTLEDLISRVKAVRSASKPK
ncbi:AAA family ATPase [Hyphobacterium sp.]|uniref:AAA family ATPase n=1 Tax=Hyphobacterium sp. TaxID=2004662 RepID=UPI003BA98E6B